MFWRENSNILFSFDINIIFSAKNQILSETFHSLIPDIHIFWRENSNYIWNDFETLWINWVLHDFLWFMQFQWKFLRKIVISKAYIWKHRRAFLGVFHLSMENIRENCIWIVVPLPMQKEIRTTWDMNTHCGNIGIFVHKFNFG